MCVLLGFGCTPAEEAYPEHLEGPPPARIFATAQATATFGFTFYMPVTNGNQYVITQSWASKFPGSECNWNGHTDPYMAYAIDFGGGPSGGKAVATFNGTVVYVKGDVTGGCYGCKSAEYNSGWGNTVIVDHGGGVHSMYNHLAPGSITVSTGQTVCTGQALGTIGTTGNSTGVHLHFQFQKGPTIWSPSVYFDGFAEISETNLICNKTFTSQNSQQCGDVPPPSDTFCQGKQNGLWCKDEALVNCQNGSISSETACPNGCQSMPAGTADQCAPDSQGFCEGKINGLWCKGDALVNCQNGSIASTTPCPNGCLSMPLGTADQCANTTDPECDGKMNGLWCNANNLVQCKDGVVTQTTACPNGCKPMPIGVNDECAEATNFCTGKANGDWCDGDNLVTCANDAIAQSNPCPNGCKPMPQEINDVCNDPPDFCDGKANGDWCDDGNLVTCANNVIAQSNPCPNGCKPMPQGTNDVCNDPPDFCDGKANGDWCNGDNLVTCANNAVAKSNPCPNGCQSMPQGTNDVCNDPPDFCDGKANGDWCDGDNLVTCANDAIAKSIPCPLGCKSMPQGTNDVCTQETVACNVNQDCNDGVTCTNDQCKEGLCVHIKLPLCCDSNADCEDDDPCTNNVCNNNTCSASIIANCCKSAAQCDDNDSCTVDTCNNGQCTHEGSCCDANSDCGDSDPCTVDACANGICYHSTLESCCTSATDCIDATPCTTDACIGNACQHFQKAGCCIADEDCSPLPAACVVAICTAGQCGDESIENCCENDLDCDDNNPCTTEVCYTSQCLYQNVNDCCEPDCASKQCGDDGCGGSCGSCEDDQICSTGGLCTEFDPEPCASMSPWGECDGTLVSWCAEGLLLYHDCAPMDMTCGVSPITGAVTCVSTADCPTVCADVACGTLDCVGPCGLCDAPLYCADKGICVAPGHVPPPDPNPNPDPDPNPNPDPDPNPNPDPAPSPSGTTVTKGGCAMASESTPSILWIGVTLLLGMMGCRRRSSDPSAG